MINLIMATIMDMGWELPTFLGGGVVTVGVIVGFLWKIFRLVDVAKLRQMRNDKEIKKIIRNQDDIMYVITLQTNLGIVDHETRAETVAKINERYEAYVERNRVASTDGREFRKTLSDLTATSDERMKAIQERFDELFKSRTQTEESENEAQE